MIAEPRNNRSRARGWCLLALALFTVTLEGATGSIRIIPFARDGQVLVSFELVDGFTEDVRAAIHSGLPTSFTYTVELRLEVPFWIDRTIASATISASVQYDNLLRSHHLSRALDGRVEDARVTEDERVVRRWMTTFERLPLFRTSQVEPTREYYVRVRGRARPRNTWSFWRWDDGPYGHAKFTFIP